MRTFTKEANQIISTRNKRETNQVNPDTVQSHPKPTKKQLIALAKEAEAVGISTQDLTEIMDFEFGKISSQDLSVIEFNWLVNHIKDLKKKQGDQGGSTEEK